MKSTALDPALIQAAQAGDEVALNEVLARSRQDLRRYAEYHCVVNDAEDAVLETLMITFRRMRDPRSMERFTSWLLRIIKRECNRMRRAWRMLARTLLANPDEAVDLSDFDCFLGANPLGLWLPSGLKTSKFWEC
jgi:DNA-directed RNA polymerase specialized sigma24 family protein